MSYDTFICTSCGHEIWDEEGECYINGTYEEAGQTFADNKCPECGGKLLLEE